MNSSSTNWTKICASLKTAKALANKDYNQTRGPIEWTKDGSQWHTQDLGYVMYWIRPVKIHK